METCNCLLRATDPDLSAVFRLLGGDLLILHQLQQREESPDDLAPVIRVSHELAEGNAVPIAERGENLFDEDLDGYVLVEDVDASVQMCCLDEAGEDDDEVRGNDRIPKFNFSEISYS